MNIVNHKFPPTLSPVFRLLSGVGKRAGADYAVRNGLDVSVNIVAVVVVRRAGGEVFGHLAKRCVNPKPSTIFDYPQSKLCFGGLLNRNCIHSQLLYVVRLANSGNSLHKLQHN